MTTDSVWEHPPSEHDVATVWRGMDDHTITVTMWAGGGTPRLRIQCHQPEGADCRLGCPNGCEDSCYCDVDPVDQGRCLAAEWIEADDPWEPYGGLGDVHVVSGAPILVRWTGDGWLWAFAPQREGERRPNGVRSSWRERALDRLAREGEEMGLYEATSGLPPALAQGGEE